MDYDLKITGGDIVDGSGADRYQGDVGIKDGVVVALGDAPGSATQTIDATGKIVSPGFVDAHTHYDAQILWDQMLTISPWHGVTTVVLGNCGFGVAPTRPEHRETIMRTLEKVEGMSMDALEAGLGRDWPFESFPEYMDAVEKTGSAINVGVLLGHTPLRLYVMGEDSTEREATPAEIEEMRGIIAEGLDAGALGFATSKSPTHVGAKGKPVPSRVSNFQDEIMPLVRVLGEKGQGLIQVTIGADVLQDEFAQMAEETGRNVTWTALLTGLSLGGKNHDEQIKKAHEIKAKGLNVYPQVTPRALNFEMHFEEPFLYESMSMFRPVSAADKEGKKEIYRDPDFRTAFKKKLQPGSSFLVASGWPKTVISFYPPDPSLEEQLVWDVAADRGVDPLDLMLDMSLETDLKARFRTPVANHNEDHVEPLLKDDTMVLGLSDAGAHASQLCDACFATYLLGHWVREKGALTLEYAVKRLTSQAAEVFGITDRGTLAVGVPADVVVFDADTVGAQELQRVHDLPGGADRLIAGANGIEAVIVNGTLLRQNDQDMLGDAALPGRLLRNGSATAGGERAAAE
jgi:N-acyl-D-amino-acid deacylase